MGKWKRAGGWLLVGLLFWAGFYAESQAGKLLLVITTDEVETVWQALRLANQALAEGDQVSLYATGKGVKIFTMEDEPLDVASQLELFLERGGRAYG